VAIMARAKGIPFVSNVEFSRFFRLIASPCDCRWNCGRVIINPTKQRYSNSNIEENNSKFLLAVFGKKKELKAVTRDGHPVRISANVEMYNEIETLDRFGGEGIGLLSNRYLFLAHEAFLQKKNNF